MTLLGKILVIVNLAFSLVTGALIVTVFATRTNWETAYKETRKSYDVAAANAKAYRDEVEEVKKQVKAAKETLETEREQAKKEIANRDELVNASRQSVDAEKSQRLKQGTLNTSSTEEIRRRRLEVDNLQRQLTEMQAKVADALKQQKASKDAEVTARINYTSEHLRIGHLLAVNEQLTKDLEQQRARTGGSMSASVQQAMKPPPDDVRGVVLESDPKTGLVTISIGSDSGINIGHTLEVYRFEPRPEYVGMIRIVDADFHRAVGRAVQPLVAGHGPIQKGDRVASKIR
jgi:hypothetical protein